MSTTRVGVLRGGPSDEYDISLASGAAVLAALSHERYADKYVLHDILIDKDGQWHISGQPALPDKIFTQTDVLVNALHGAYGEDGKIQVILDEHGVLYTGSRALPSAVGMNKVLTKKVFAQHGIKTPKHIIIESARTTVSSDEVIRHIFNTFSMPVVVKPVGSGSSVGISIARSFADIAPAVQKANLKSRDGSVMIEEYISGKEATVGVIDGFRGESCYALPAIEIRYDRDFFDYEAKYSETHGAEEIVPGHFSVEEKAELERLARDIHVALGLRHYSRSDFIVTSRRGIYALEVNTLPGLTPASLLPKALTAVGSSLPDFLDHIIGLALAGK
jgi:D-alanine-D-alanine ligase